MAVAVERSSQTEMQRLEAAADQAIAVSGGDMRATIIALILANEFFEIEVERFRVDAELWRAACSHGYTRGRREWTAEEIERWGQEALDRMDASHYE